MNVQIYSHPSTQHCSMLSTSKLLQHTNESATNNDIVNGNVDEFDEEANESHDGESNSCCHGDLLEFFSVWFCASFDESDGVLDKLAARLHKLHYLIHDGFGCVSRRRSARRLRAAALNAL